MEVTAKIDPKVLEELRSVGGAEFVRQVVDTFLEVQRASVTQMREALDQRDAQALERSAHRLKGSCASVGAAQAAHLCLELQGCGKAGHLEPAAPVVAALQDELTMVVDSLKAIVGGT